MQNDETLIEDDQARSQTRGDGGEMVTNWDGSGPVVIFFVAFLGSMEIREI